MIRVGWKLGFVYCGVSVGELFLFYDWIYGIIWIILDLLVLWRFLFYVRVEKNVFSRLVGSGFFLFL